MITAPVTIDKVKTTLGETSNDLGTLCKSAKINPWARCKPINHTGTTLLESPVVEDTRKGERLDDFTRIGCGMVVPIGKEADFISAGETNYMSVFVQRYFGSPKLPGSTYTPYEYFPVDGGSSRPYRLTDFKDYDENAECMFRMRTNVDGTDRVDVDEQTGKFVYRATFGLSQSTLYNQLRPEDLLCCFHNVYSEWKLRVEVSVMPDETIRYYDFDLADSQHNNYYAIVEIPITRNPSMPISLDCEVRTQAYFYCTQTKEAIVFPQQYSYKQFIINPPKMRNVNIPSVYNGTSWVIPSSVSMYANQLRVQFDVEQTSTSIQIGKYADNQIRVTCQSTSDSSKHTVTVGAACDYNGSGMSSWTVPQYSGTSSYTTTYFSFTPFCDYIFNHGETANLTFEMSSDGGSTWRMIGGFAVTLNF